MNPIDIIKNKLGELGIPQDAIASLDINSITSNLANPDNLKSNIINQLIEKIGLDSSMVNGVLSNINFGDLLNSANVGDILKDAVSKGVEGEVAQKAGGIIGFLKGLFGLK
ncbi:MAG: hypothetical protein ACRCXZ_05475 [Patescibacteria group bacterium]